MLACGILMSFTPLESPAARGRVLSTCSGDEDKIPFGANTGFKALCEPSRYRVEDFLTGFTASLRAGMWQSGERH